MSSVGLSRPGGRVTGYTMGPREPPSSWKWVKDGGTLDAFRSAWPGRGRVGVQAARTPTSLLPGLAQALSAAGDPSPSPVPVSAALPPVSLSSQSGLDVPLSPEASLAGLLPEPGRGALGAQPQGSACRVTLWAPGVGRGRAVAQPGCLSLGLRHRVWSRGDHQAGAGWFGVALLGVQSRPCP